MNDGIRLFFEFTVKKTHLYILSGTGNTFRVGCRLHEMFEEAGIGTTLEMIEDADPENRIDSASDPMVGLLFPTHGFMPPWSMIKFILRFPRKPGVRAFCAATRGSLVIGPLQIPGAAGFATFFAALVLLLKGYRIKGVFSVDMPSNMINLHWGLHEKNTSRIIRKTDFRIQRLFVRLLKGDRIFFTRNNLWELGWTVLILWLVPIFPLLYLLYGKLFMAKLMYSDNRCVGCGLCAKSCPNHAIEMKKVGDRSYPFWTFHCENCLRCMGYCNRKAVEAGHSWAVGLFYITSVPVIFWITLWLSETFPIIPVPEDYWIRVLLDYIYIFPAVIISYRLFWYLIRWKPLNTLFSYTTLTRFFRRYHEPDTKLKHLTLKSTRKKAVGKAPLPGKELTETENTA